MMKSPLASDIAEFIPIETVTPCSAVPPAARTLPETLDRLKTTPPSSSSELEQPVRPARATRPVAKKRWENRNPVFGDMLVLCQETAAL